MVSQSIVVLSLALGIKSGIERSRRISYISSLCEAIQTAPSPNTNLGFLANVSAKRGVHITTTRVHVSSDVADPVSLDSLLPSSKSRYQGSRSSCRLSRQQRLSIAVSLAHGLLQLHESPWLNEAWSKSDIWFWCVDAQRRPIIEQPYVSRSFWPKSKDFKETGPSDTNLTDIFSTQIISKSLFALGIVLIELCFNKTFEDLCAEAQGGPDPAVPKPPPDAAEIYAVATSLIDDFYEE